MSSLYEMLAGQSPYSQMALAILNLSKNDVPRYRDASLVSAAQPSESWMVNILTRTGGPNRSHFDTATLTSHPLYVSDVDMKADETYAIYTFRFPDELRGLGNWIVRTEVLEGDERVDAWVTLFNKLNKLKLAFPDSPYIKSMKLWITPVMQQLMDEGKIDVVDVS